MDLEGLVKSLIGKRLLTIDAECHEYLSVVNIEEPIALRLNFEDNHHIRLRLASDGQSIIIDDNQLHISNMDEYGKILIIEYTKVKLIEYKGSRLKGAYSIGSTDGNILIGIRLSFDKLNELIIINYGDEFNIGISYPDNVPEYYKELFSEKPLY